MGVPGPSTGTGILGLLGLTGEGFLAAPTLVLQGNSQRENDHFAPLPGLTHSGPTPTSDKSVVAQSDAEGQVRAARALTAIESLACGGMAGATAKTVIAPMDRVKILFQTDAQRRFSLNAAWRTGSGILREEGLTALWRGHGATLLRVVPYSAASYATFDIYKKGLKDAFPNSGDVLVRFLAGAGAGMTATGLTYPLDMLRARMAVRHASLAATQSYWQASTCLIRDEGARVIWSGLRPTLLGIVPYSGLSFCLFETIKAKVLEHRGLGPEGKLQVQERLLAGALSGLLAQSATYPLDVVRRRMQVDPTMYPSELVTLRSILATENVRGLFKGVTMNWLKGPIAISVSFAINDALRESVSHWP